MNIAIDDKGNRITASNAVKGEIYKCPLCNAEVIVKQGEINIDHFAHKSHECLDSWHYDMSEWHYSMQNRFPEEQREVVVRHNGEIHRADILFGKQVVEFQHSQISIEEVKKRNKFYRDAGYDIAWVFDVQQQFDAGQIEDVEYDDALMYKWSNPKRMLQCFPMPKEYNKNLVIYLYWIDSDGIEEFNRIIWSSGDDYTPDFKRFIVSNRGIYTEDVSDALDINKFFMTRDDRLKKYLATLKYWYVIKRKGSRGYPKNDYICPRTKEFGLKQSGEKACQYCRYCAAIKRIKDGFESYCCYPNQVNEITEIHPGYECCNIPEF